MELAKGTWELFQEDLFVQTILGANFLSPGCSPGPGDRRENIFTKDNFCPACRQIGGRQRPFCVFCFNCFQPQTVFMPK